MTALSIADVRAARERIDGFVHRTPVHTSRQLNERAGVSIYCKCENFQRVGAFKFRGACNAVRALGDDTNVRAVVTHSSGNHAQALALAAQIAGLEAHIVMPKNAPQVKKDAVRGYSGIIYECEPTSDARHGMADEVVADTGGVLIPPYDHEHIIAGQGTAALELLEDVPDLDAIMAPVGGGGLMSGTCLAAYGTREDIVLFGAEPSAADDAARSLHCGERQPAPQQPQTIADGLLTGLGEQTWSIIRDHVREIFTVDDDAIRDAMQFVWQRMKIVIEPSAAVPIAAACTEGFAHCARAHNVRRLGIIISGGNVAATF